MYTFNNFLTEKVNNTQRIYCDMDGVLVDFVKGLKLQTGMTPQAWMNLPYKERWAMIDKNKRFWKDLPWLSGGKQLWSFLKKHDAHILSAGTSDPTSKSGKYGWIKRNLNLSSNDPKIHIVLRSEKKRFAKTSNGTPNILIDDFGRNTKEWKRAGGIAIKHRSYSETMSQLRKLI